MFTNKYVYTSVKRVIKPLSEPMLAFCQSDHSGQIEVLIKTQSETFSFNKMHFTTPRLQNVVHFVKISGFTLPWIYSIGHRYVLCRYIPYAYGSGYWMVISSRSSDTSANWAPISLDNRRQTITWIWSIFDWTIGGKVQLNLNQNITMFIQGNVFENVRYFIIYVLC